LNIAQNLHKVLIYFTVGNYKSIKDQLTLDFRASSISEHVDSNINKIEKEVLLKTILLYGHNASGKSKILDAFIFFKNFINRSTSQEDEDLIDVDNFRLSETTDGKPSFFEACFILNKTKYRYGFEANKKAIIKEWLLEAKIKKEYPLFLRIGDEFQIDGKRFENAEGLDKRTRINALFLSVASQWNVLKAQKINLWFRSIFTVSGLKDNRNFRHLTIELLNQKKFSNLIHKFIQKADLGINGINLRDIPLSPRILSTVKQNNIRRFLSDEKIITALHNKYDADNKIVGTEEFRVDADESEGTKKYLSLIGIFLTAIYENRLIVMDEFDARLHTLLSKAILKIFNSSKIKSSSQLLVASHDTALLDKNILRRDQIYFVEKDIYGVTHVNSLVEYKVRKESPYDKNYLDGRYGAIPFIDDLETIVANGQKE
jgi:uncharacterized protein